MACGTPVIGTRVGGIPEVVESGESGFLVDVEDREAYSLHLAALLGNRAKAAAMGAKARERAVQRFDRDHVVRSYERLYQGLIDGAEPCLE
jgi:starch synthase